MAAARKVWDPELNKMASYRDLINHSNKAICELWNGSGENEFGRLFQGYIDSHKDVEGLDVMDWTTWDAVPKHKKVT